MNRLRYSLTVLLLLSATALQSATYYIDYANGSDSNNGMGTNAPWKTCPYMVNSAVSGYSHLAGDRFIFRGGVTWPINTTGAVYPKAGGSAAAPDYYGVSKVWYAGASWTRPVFNGGDTDAAGFKLVYSGGQANIVMDNIEFTNWFLDVCILAQTVNTTNCQVLNVQFDGWNTNGATGDGVFLYCHDNSQNFGTVSNCFINGGNQAAPNSGIAFYNFTGLITASTVTNFASCADGFGGVFSFNVVGNQGASAWGGHPDGVRTAATGVQIHHNRFIDAMGNCILSGSGSTANIWDNLFYDTSRISSGPLWIYDAYSTGFNCWNNTLVCTYTTGAMYLTGGDVAFNNHLIDGGITGGSTLANLSQTSAQATTAGYTAANQWQPISGAASTVGAGTNLYSAGVTNDLLLAARPAAGAFDVGAYQYQTVTNSPPGPLTITAAGINVQSIYQ